MPSLSPPSLPKIHTADWEVDIGDHPVFQALPESARDRLRRTGGHACAGAFGPSLAPDELHFVLRGAVGLFPAEQVCVSIVPAGAVQGWDRAYASDLPSPLATPLVETLLFSAPASALVDTLGRDWLRRLVAVHSLQRLREVEAEACCNASHTVLERLAKWIVRLHISCGRAPLRVTQSQLGRILGVQRTSINIAAAHLQALGLVRLGRGRLHVIDLPGLRLASCGCDSHGADPVVLQSQAKRSAETKNFLQEAPEPRERLA